MTRLGTPGDFTIDDLAPAPYNPREITHEAADGLRASLSQFGDISGITFNKRSGVLVCGHQRVKQLKGMGAVLDGGSLVLPDGTRFPIRIVDWSLGEEMGANLEANNRHIEGEFTDGLPARLDELENLTSEDFLRQLRLDLLEPAFDGEAVADTFAGGVEAQDESGQRAITIIFSDGQAEVVERFKKNNGPAVLASEIVKALSHVARD